MGPNHHLQRAPSNPDYQRYYSLLNPKSLFPCVDLCYLRAAYELLRAGGIGPIKRALTRGQHDFPEGLYYGGDQKSPSILILEEFIGREWSNAKKIVGVEVHSGLGEFDESTLLLSAASDQDLIRDLRRVASQFDIEIEGDEENKVSVSTVGAIGDAVCQLFPNCKTVWLTQEIGTYGLLRVFKGLRAENVCW